MRGSGLKIKSYFVSSPIKGICKQYGIWVSGNVNSIMPLIYLQKPKYIDENKWDEICKSVKITLPEGFEV